MKKLLDKLEKEGKLSKQKAGSIQIEEMLKAAISDLEEARKVRAISDKATYLMAYNAMLKAGRALLLLHGLRPDDGAQHKTVVEATGAILGDKFKQLVAQFETMRRKRNEFTYGGFSASSGSEAGNAFADAIELVKEILKEAKKRNPQMRLGL